ncbi:hypothetical protein FBEOM_2025 [Fusarium beomiforme]|uniref:Uncharacterized protein n=1 Tax=Fusarium beomiforme TaxID=44412 RepID=A0A9P5ASQ8_9HYPO|nr:hypothetical protein FBEOM_2025 [Fusarium beomiforme]
MVERSFRYLSKINATDLPFQQFSIKKEWRAWEIAWLYRLPQIITHATVPARLIEGGCEIDGVVNCTKACESEKYMFETPETLWNCLTIATVAMMTTNGGPDTISNETLDKLETEFNTGPLNEFHRRHALLKYVKCALQSCSDSKFGGCPPGNIMSGEYCNKADPGIDWDMAGPGIIVAYLIQFTIVLFFALCYKTSRTWIRNFTLITLLPFQGPIGAAKTAYNWQKSVHKSRFGVAVGSVLVDLQEAQAVFLATVSAASIITFSGSGGTGLANISSLVSWLTNNLASRGMISAGMYPLLFVQLILQKTNNRWWYTLFLVFINWVLILVISRPQTVDNNSLLEHFKESSGLERCGNSLGPRTFCQTFNQPSQKDIAEERPDYLNRDAENFFEFHSQIHAPMHVIMAFLILDWVISMIKIYIFERDWVSHKANAWVDRLPLRLKTFYTGRYFVLYAEALWILMEALTIAMGAIGAYEFTVFLDVLQGPGTDKESKIYITKWGFGQLVALCVWVPVIIKFVSLMVDGALPGWRKRLGKSVDITQCEETELDGDDIAMEALLPSRPTKRGQGDEMERETLTVRHSWDRTPS